LVPQTPSPSGGSAPLRPPRPRAPPSGLRPSPKALRASNCLRRPTAALLASARTGATAPDPWRGRCPLPKAAPVAQARQPLLVPSPRLLNTKWWNP